MKKIFALCFVLALLFSTVACLSLVSLVTANPLELQFLPETTILSDGNITGPRAEFINRTGNTYILTANIEDCVLVIKRSNIVFDGAGHLINTTNGDNAALGLFNVVNVVVKDLEVFSRYNSIYLADSSNCLLTGVKTNNRIYLISGSDFNTILESSLKSLNLGRGSNDNLIAKNNVSKLFVYGHDNIFTQNNFFLTELPSIFNYNLWDDGSVGNYWSNYTIKYPNAIEVGNTGIGNTSYTIDRDSYSKQFPGRCIDLHPLLYPWGTPQLTMLEVENVTYPQTFSLNFTLNKPTRWMGYSLNGKANLTFTGNITFNDLAPGLYNLTIYFTDVYGLSGDPKTVYFTIMKPVDLFPIALIAGASTVSISTAALLLFYYHKKHSN